jgi:MarR family 2-MHQ and catechol resistance regulon transcriptional repressor
MLLVARLSGENGAFGSVNRDDWAFMTGRAGAAPDQGGRRGTRGTTLKDRSARAFRVYLELLDTADWIRRELRGQLESFDLTIEEFRLLEMLHRSGPMTTVAICERRRCRRQTLFYMIEQLSARGWVRCDTGEFAPADVKESHLAKSVRGRPRRGRRVGVVRLTSAGEKFIGGVFPRHAKMVFALMKAIDAREQESIKHVCQKLREGDPVKFIKEMIYVGVRDLGWQRSYE